MGNSHVKQRAKERYGIDLSNKKLKKLLRQINDRTANFLRHDGPCKDIYGCSLEGKRLRVVYDRYQRRIRTVLPNEPK